MNSQHQSAIVSDLLVCCCIQPFLYLEISVVMFSSSWQQHVRLADSLIFQKRCAKGERQLDLKPSACCTDTHIMEWKRRILQREEKRGEQREKGDRFSCIKYAQGFSQPQVIHKLAVGVKRCCFICALIQFSVSAPHNVLTRNTFQEAAGWRGRAQGSFLFCLSGGFDHRTRRVNCRHLETRRQFKTDLV